MTTVADHFEVAEYVGADYSAPVLGHFYYYKNDPIGHDNHVHVAHRNPWWKPDGAKTKPPVLGSPAKNGTAWVLSFRAAVDAHFGKGAYPTGGIYVPKHRNSDPAQPWSQHTGANAEDFMCDHAGADKFVAWLGSEWKEEDDMAIQDFLEGFKERFDTLVGNPADAGDDAMKKVDGDDRKAGRRLAEATFMVMNGKIPPMAP